MQHKALNGWNLLALIALPISVAVLVTMLKLDMSRAANVSAMIQLSVRCAVPLLYLAFAASSLYALFPGDLSRWLLRNRGMLGFAYASAMAWQGLFIVWLVTVHREYYIGEVYVLRDAIEGVLGYGFLIAMTITSFKFTRSRMKPKHWKLLHTSGIYFLWAYAFSVYWYQLFYYQEQLPIDYIYYWAGFLACALRTAAWAKQRWQQAEKNTPDARAIPSIMILGLVVVALGLIASATGSHWSEYSDALFYGYAVTQPLELYLPYYAPTAYIANFILLLGALLVVKARS
jgi:hypothetical protein